MGSHNSSSTGRKWLNLGSLEWSWQGLVPFGGFEFYKKLTMHSITLRRTVYIAKLMCDISCTA